MTQETLKLTEQLDEQKIDSLVRDAQLGDREAFSQLYEHFMPFVYKRVMYVVPSNDVEDVTQEVFIAAMRFLESFRGDSKFSTWLRVITNRQIANFYRSREKSQPQEETNIEDVDAKQMYKAVGSSYDLINDNMLMIQDGLMKLPDHYREILLLRFAEGLKFQEIAVEMERSVEATKSLFRRSIEAVRKEIGEQND